MDRYDIDFEIVGKAAWLWGCSALHKSWPISIFHNNILPAIIHKQYVLLMKNDYPVAWCSWANLSLENEVKYIMDTNSLVADDWISGDRKWFIDWIAPFGHTRELYMHMREHYPHSLFRAIRVKCDSAGLSRCWKNHLTIALVVKAADAGHRVLFMPLNRLLAGKPVERHL
ncbi:toxin-activating lysine-acyltransferase [Escherichia coli]|nr:toxin-activating lysine-acyltransferase [Escherichia coli]